MISAEGQALGHKYEMSWMGGGCWCYQHELPTMFCSYDDEDESEA